MKIDNIAFLIPIHTPHYHYMYKLLKKIKNNDIEIDIFLIFSNTTDYNNFLMKNEIKPIICDNSITVTRSIVTFKKFYGLKQLINSKYDYIICCDSEIDILCSNFTNENINNKIRNIFNTKKIYAGDTSGIEVARLITQTSANLFPDKHDFLKNITNNFTLYFWWSDLPVYRTTDIAQFLNMINYTNINWYHFDYIIYQYYLILYHGFEIVNTTPITNLNWSFETLDRISDINILKKLVDINYGFSWSTKKNYEQNKNFIESQKGFLIYHLDRFR
jgi:hypothetical protein